MPHIHFIAIGGAAMHSLAITLSISKEYKITGSDDEIFEPSYSRLLEHGLLPEKMGWQPEKITEKLTAIVLGMHAKEDNPELIRAKELGLKIYSFPEFLYKKTIGKIRVVIGGSHGKTSTTAMILHVFNKLNIKADYMLGAQIDGMDNMVKLSYDSRIVVFEGDEYLTSPLDKRPKFHHYHPHIAVLTGIAWDHINAFPTFENYLEQFKVFTDLIELQGRLIYFSEDKNLQAIAEGLRSDIVSLPYATPNYELKEGLVILKTKKGETALKIFGEHNLQNMEAARLVCKQLGVSDSKFYAAIADFSGARNRLQKILETKDSVVYKDFAHSPSKLLATVRAVKQQYPDKKLIACMELHTFSSLTDSFLSQYSNTMQEADFAFVYYNPEVVSQKRLNPLRPEQVKEAFGGDNVCVFTDSEVLCKAVKALELNNSALLFMSSGNFAGIELTNFSNELFDL